MLKKTGRIWMVLCALILIIGIIVFAGCGGDKDLKGKTIVFGNWWADWNVRTFEPNNEGEAMQLDWRRRLQREMGFTMYEEQITDWDNYFQTITNIILSGDKKYSAFQVSADWAMSLFREGLLAPLPTDEINIAGQGAIGELDNPGEGQPPYNAMMARLFTFNGKQYALAFSEGNNSWQSILILFNKRLLQEVGIDPELPYNLQASGEWTWDVFLDMLRRTTRDIDNDGITDIWGTHTDSDADVLSAIVYSNNANLVTFDNNGRAVLATTTPEYMEAVQFFWQILEEGLMMRQPEGAQWAWQIHNFIDGRIAFFVGQEWFKNFTGDMRDDYGSVVFPKGPRATNYRVSVTENVTIIPAMFMNGDDDTEVRAIIRALDRWMVPMDTNWQAGHYHVYRDRRAVDETIALTKDPSGRYITYRNFMLIPGLYDQLKNFMYELNNFSGNPAQLVEEYVPIYMYDIDDFNGE